MRQLTRIIAIVLLVGVSGCSSPSPDRPPREPAVPGPGPVATRGGGLGALNVSSGSESSTNRTTAKPVPLPASGRVHSVNPGLRFVVIDYTLGGMPPLQSILNVYRGNEKVGQIRLSGPERNGFVAGDVIEGLLQVDDEVRLN